MAFIGYYNAIHIGKGYAGLLMMGQPLLAFYFYLYYTADLIVRQFMEKFRYEQVYDELIIEIRAKSLDVKVF